MALRRGADIRGWGGVTKNLAANEEEQAAWYFTVYSGIAAIAAAGLAALLLSQSDDLVVAKALLCLGLLGVVLVLISGVYAQKVHRATSPGTSAAPEVIEGQPQEILTPRRTHSMTPAAAAPMMAAPEPAPAPVPEPAPAPVAEVADVPEEVAGTRPQALDGARDGTPDDLTLIKGVGPKLAELCHSLGFYHFDQIAAWTEDEVAWVDQNLEGFKGRVSRDDWVSQAKILAAGGETEFSSRQG